MIHNDYFFCVFVTFYVSSYFLIYPLPPPHYRAPPDPPRGFSQHELTLLDSQHKFLPQEVAARKQGILAARVHAAKTLPKVGRHTGSAPDPSSLRRIRVGTLSPFNPTRTLKLLLSGSCHKQDPRGSPLALQDILYMDVALT